MVLLRIRKTPTTQKSSRRQGKGSKHIVDNFPPLTDEEKQYLDPEIFFHKILCLDIAHFHKQWIEYAEKYRFVCIMAPRQHGKTEILIVGYTLFKLYEAILNIKRGYRNRPYSAMIVSKTMPQSTEVLRRLKYKMMDSPVLREYLPSGREGRMASTQLLLKGRHRILCRPYSDSVRGETLDICCIDECGTYEDKEIFKYALMPTIQKYDGKIIAIGTPTSHTDLLFELFENPVFVSKKYQVYTDENRKKSLWVSEFPASKLETIKQAIGTLSFSREFMCEPLGEEDRIFRYDDISSGFLPNTSWVMEKRPNCTYWMGADFAMSGKVGSDFTVYTVIEKDCFDKLQICYIFRTKGMPYEAQMNYLLELNEKYRFTRILIDERSFGQTFLQQVRNKGINIEGWKFGPKDSKEQIIMHLANQFEKKVVLIPRGMECLTNTNQLIKELTAFSAELNVRTGNIKFEGKGEHDDMVVSLALAVFAATRRSGALSHIARSSYGRK